MQVRQAAAYLIGLSVASGVAAGVDSASAQPTPEYTVEPVNSPFMLPETQKGELHFEITDNLSFPLTVGGYLSIIQFLFGDRTDDFGHTILGPATPYLLLPDVPQDVPVFIKPDLEMDDSPLDSGHWSFELGAQVFVEPPFDYAFGHEVAAEVIIFDVVDEPSTAALLFGGLVGAALVRHSRRRWRKRTSGADS